MTGVAARSLRVVTNARPGGLGGAALPPAPAGDHPVLGAARDHHDVAGTQLEHRGTDLQPALPLEQDVERHLQLAVAGDVHPGRRAQAGSACRASRSSCAIRSNRLTVSM